MTAIVVGGGVLTLVWGIVALRRRWLAQEATRIDAAIRANAFLYKPGHAHADDHVRRRAAHRRTEAAQLRAHAAAIESGTSMTTAGEQRRA